MSSGSALQYSVRWLKKTGYPEEKRIGLPPYLSSDQIVCWRNKKQQPAQIGEYLLQLQLQFMLHRLVNLNEIDFGGRLLPVEK